MRKGNRNTAAEKTVLASGLTALMAGTAFLFAAVATLQTMNRSAVTLDTQSYSWLTRARIGFDTVSDIEKTLAAMALGSLPEEAAPIVAEKIETQPVARVASRGIASVERRKARASRVVPTQVISQDRIAQSAAAAAPVESAADEAQGFRQMYRQMRGQFFATLEGKANLTTQVAIREEAPAPKAAIVRVAKVRRVVTTKKSRTPTAHATRLKRPAYRLAPMGPEASLVMTGGATVNKLESGAALDILHAKAEASVRQVAELSAKIFKAEVAQAPVTSTLITSAAAPVVMASESAPVSVTRGETRMLVSNAPGYSAPVEYSFPTLDQFRLALDTQVAKRELPTSEETKFDGQPDVPFVGAPVVEAFQWKTPVAGYKSENITLEGWKLVAAEGHWSTVFWNPESQSQAAMISYNTAQMLAKLADAQIQPETAIVFGKIPAGWDVEYSGRSEKVVYLSAQNMPAPFADDARYFAFVNAAPGAHTVILRAHSGSGSASVAVPVLSAAAAYLDLSAVTQRSLSGMVLEASATRMQGLSDITVSVVDQPGAVRVTGSDGSFNLSEVHVVGDFPVFVETDATQAKQGGYKHRYRVSPGRMDGVSLFRMSESQIHAWIGQLEGGISPESGLVVAAMPKLIKRFGDGRLFPSVHPIAANNTLSPPETYTVSDEGQLQVGSALEGASSRFVSVQVPEGLVAAQVEDNNRNVVWSQLLIAQPGVVNVIGEF